MDLDFLILNIAVFGAAALQSATGIGFGIIAGPVLLIAFPMDAPIFITSREDLVLDQD